MVVNGATSSSTIVTSGVPQGTVLGPLLFLLYINDLPDNLSTSVRLFADDCILYTPIRTQNDSSLLQNDLLKLQKWQDTWLMKFTPNNYSREPGSVTKLLQELGWETLQARRKHKRITTLYKMEHNIIDIPLDQYIIHNTRCSRKHNSQFLQIIHSSNTFGKSFFPTTAKEWNALPSDIISSSSIESFKTKLSKYLLDH